MRESFNPERGLVVIPVQVFGPSGDTFARLAVDTGAITTVISPEILALIGYDLAQAPDERRLVSATDVISVLRFLVEKVVAMEQERAYVPVLGHALPKQTGVDGALGLDFYRGRRLTVNFRQGRVSLA